MEIKGIVVSGQGKGAYFMSRSFYKDQFEKKLNFTPFPGTLNIKISESEIQKIHQIKKDKMEKIKGEGNFGDVLLIKAVLNNDICGAVVFPKKTTHGENILEFITSIKVKESLEIKNGHKVKLNLEY
jgi:riboflavin kinase